MDEDEDDPLKSLHPFERLRHQGAEDRERADEERFEDSRVAYIVRTMSPQNAKRWISRVRARAEEATGNPNLTFDAFDEVFETFPFYLGSTWLGGKSLHLDPTAMIPACFRNFQRVPFVRAFASFFEAAAPVARGRPVGLIFPRKGIKHGMVITSGLPEAMNFRGLTWVYHGGTRQRQQKLYVVLLQSLLEALHNKGHGWKPGDVED